MWSVLLPLAGLLSIPITFLICAAARHVVKFRVDIKHWPPNYWC
jgi:hypothetical protein